MLPHRLEKDAPALYRVTLLAVRAHLATVNVGVTVRAVRARIGEHHLGVALGASHILVQAAQGIAGLVVIELGNCPDRLPPHRGVAVLTRDAQVAMRTTRDRLRLTLGETQPSGPA